ncbi:hypothetical protein [Macellibacteroides fermentans]
MKKNKDLQIVLVSIGYVDLSIATLLTKHHKESSEDIRKGRQDL